MPAKHTGLRAVAAHVAPLAPNTLLVAGTRSIGCLQEIRFAATGLPYGRDFTERRHRPAHGACMSRMRPITTEHVNRNADTLAFTNDDVCSQRAGPSCITTFMSALPMFERGGVTCEFR